MQKPPNYIPKEKKSISKSILKTVGIVALSGVVGFGAGYIGSKSTNTTGSVTINSQTGNNAKGQIQVTDVSDIVAKCGPSVVEITTDQATGSGVIISEDGYIVTNNHVIEDASSIEVKTTNSESYDAKLVGTDSATDLAVLKINAEDLTTATFGDSDALEVGDPAIAIGNPLGSLGGTVTCGIISARDRQIEINGEIYTLMQTDAAVNPGNSGGGLFDANGNLIGIVSAKYSRTDVEGIGFAIPINDAESIITELMENGSITSRPALNISITDYTSNSYNYYFGSNDDKEDGVYIVQIIENGAADKADLWVNDRIVSFDGEEITSTSQLRTLVRKHKIGDKVEIVIERDGKKMTKTVTLQAQTNSN